MLNFKEQLNRGHFHLMRSHCRCVIRYANATARRADPYVTLLQQPLCLAIFLVPLCTPTLLIGLWRYVYSKTILADVRISE